MDYDDVLISIRFFIPNTIKIRFLNHSLIKYK